MVYLNYAMAIVMKFISVICWIIQFWILGLLVSPAMSYRDEWMFIQALWKQRCFNSELWLKKPLGWFLGLLCQQPTCGAASRILNNDNHKCLMPVPVPPALPWPDMSPKTCPQACGHGFPSCPSEVVMITSCSGWTFRKQAPISPDFSCYSWSVVLS